MAGYCSECDSIIESHDPGEWLCVTCRAEAIARSAAMAPYRAAVAERNERLAAAFSQLPPAVVTEWAVVRKDRFGRPIMGERVKSVALPMEVGGFQFRPATGDEGRPTGGWELVPSAELDGDALRPKWHRD